MTTELSSSSCVRLVLVSTAPNAALAAEILGHHLEISAETALQRLSAAPSVLAHALDPERARRIANLMRSFGLRVRLDGPGVAGSAVDLSVQLSVPVRVQRAVRLIAAETGIGTAEVMAALQRPGGLVLRGLPPDEAMRLQKALGRLSSVSVTRSDPASAVYDVFLPRGTPGAELSERLRMMGAHSDPITGAVAAGLDGALCDRLVSRFPEAGLLVLNRAFERFDLYLTRVTGWVTRDLADFLAARTGHPRSRFEVVSDGSSLRIELGLGYAAARQFRADYASIGLHTMMLLSGLAEDTGDFSG